MERLGEKPRTVYLPIRVAVTGSRISPGLYESLELLGREESLRRLRQGAELAAVPRYRSHERVLRELGGTGARADDWLEVTQERIDAFADATDDHQWIHVDPERAAAGPFGTTIAHGYLTLALCAPLLSRRPGRRHGSGMSINYGTNKVRFPAPVPVGSRIRARVTVASVDDVPGGEQMVVSRRSSARVATSPSAWPSS